MQDLMAMYANTLQQPPNSTNGANQDLMALNQDPLTRYMIAQYVQSLNTDGQPNNQQPMGMMQQPMQPPQMQPPMNPMSQLMAQYANQGAQ